MAYTGQMIADRAWAKANDKAAVRWTPSDALMWLNDALRETVVTLPSANSVTSVVPVAANNARQTLSGLGLTRAISVADILRNINADGSPGRSVSLIKREYLDRHNPEWTQRMASEARHWMYDARDPDVFYLDAQIIGGGKIEIVCPTLPAEVASLASPIPIADTYVNALQAHLLFSFYSNDATYTTASQKAAAYFQLFQQALGIKASSGAQSIEKAKVNSSAGPTA